ncbi:hypothetical protein IAU60_002624 [Kwoniella sp. DSM 27419]
MATVVRASPAHTPPASSPPTPPTNYPSFPRLSSPSIQRNASTSSSRSTTTVSSTSSIQAAPMRPPPIETSTAATSNSQIPSRAESENESERGAPRLESVRGGLRGGRNWGRNGPRTGRIATPTSAYTPSHSPPPILHTPQSRRPSASDAGSIHNLSPTTPRGPQLPPRDPLPSPGPLRVTVSMAQNDMAHHESRSLSAPGDRFFPVRGRGGHLTAPSSPTDTARPGSVGMKQRTLSVDGAPSSAMDRRTGSAGSDRERRQSQASSHSQTASAPIKKPSIRDFILGEELGQGSYSTVYAATAISSSSSRSPKLPRKYAIKIINQHHLVQEKKVKYAMIERDALVRLSVPRQSASPTTARGHRRGLSSSSSGGYTNNGGITAAANRRSVASVGSSTGTGSTRKESSSTAVPGGRDRLSIVTTSSNGEMSPVLSGRDTGTPLSPIMKTFGNRRLSRSTEHPESVPEQSEVLSLGESTAPSRSRPPSPVAEEDASQDDRSVRAQRSASRSDDRPVSGYATPEVSGSPRLGASELPRAANQVRTPRKRRQSQAPSEKSTRSSSSKAPAHPGVIRLHSTFNDSTSLYFVLDLASNGEMTSFIRQHGSLDLVSARYYAAQLIDTIEFMHDKGVVHRDLKPENILLDEEMRVKITDFGSAKLLYKEEQAVDDGKKRSFVGSADFVSPEVLRNEPASVSSDIWAFGCILYQFFVGKPPFRAATDYLTFQRILKRDMEYPDGMDDDAKALIELVLNLDPLLRPSVQDIKSHPFFALTDFLTIWTVPAPLIRTGLTEPVATLATVDPGSDMWAVFDDEVSDGGFEYDQDHEPDGPANQSEQTQAEDNEQTPRGQEPLFDRRAAAHAVRHVDFPDSAHDDFSEELGPPRPAYAVESQQERDRDSRKSRGWSHGSSSSGGNRSALTGWLESMRLGGTGPGHASGSVSGFRSNRTSRTSVRSDEYKVMMGSTGSMPPSQSGSPAPRVSTDDTLKARAAREGGQSAGTDSEKWASLLLENERIIFTSAILTRTSSPSRHLPAFLLPAPKPRQLILTDFPRLITVKDDPYGQYHPQAPTAGQAIGQDGSTLKIKGECIFVSQPLADTGGSEAGRAGPANSVINVQERGSRGFTVHTAGMVYWHYAESVDLRDRWLSAIRRVGADL